MHTENDIDYCDTNVFLYSMKCITFIMHVMSKNKLYKMFSAFCQIILLSIIIKIQLGAV